jgi:CRP-like cAMP-binding protein
MVWIPGGAVLMEVGEEATWMGLLVQGALQINGKDGSEAQVMKPGDLVGDEILSGALRRKLTLLTTEPTLLLRWEYGWVQQWIPRISSEREYGALEQYLQVQ